MGPDWDTRKAQMRDVPNLPNASNGIQFLFFRRQMLESAQRQRCFKETLRPFCKENRGCRSTWSSFLLRRNCNCWVPYQQPLLKGSIKRRAKIVFNKFNQKSGLTYLCN